MDRRIRQTEISDGRLITTIRVGPAYETRVLCGDYWNLFGRPYTILRYGIPFGPRMRSDLVIAAFMERALRGEPLNIDGDDDET